MSFSRIAVSQAVKKIVLYVRSAPNWLTFEDLAKNIEEGDWKKIELPRPEKKKAKKKK